MARRASGTVSAIALVGFVAMVAYTAVAKRDIQSPGVEEHPHPHPQVRPHLSVQPAES